MVSEADVKNRICPCCHVALMYEHPEYKFASQHYFKCIVCGYTEQRKKVIKEIHKIINGKPRE